MDKEVPMTVDAVRERLDSLSLENYSSSPEVFLVDDEGRAYALLSIYKEGEKVFFSIHRS